MFAIYEFWLIVGEGCWRSILQVGDQRSVPERGVVGLLKKKKKRDKKAPISSQIKKAD